MRSAEIYQRAAARFASTSLAINAAAVGSRPETSVGKNSQRLKKSLTPKIAVAIVPISQELTNKYTKTICKGKSTCHVLLSPFTRETAIEKVRLAFEDGWNSRDAAKVALAHIRHSLAEPR